MKKILLACSMFSFSVFGIEFIDLAKRTNSVYSGIGEIDSHNPLKVEIETTLTGQKVFMALSSRNLNTTFYTLVNSDASFKNKLNSIPPQITVNNLEIQFNGELNPTGSCDGALLSSNDTSCEGKNCNVAQRVISLCNDSDCWAVNPSIDRSLTDGLKGAFSLKDKVEITDCFQNNSAGQKHELTFTVENISSTVLSGGSIQYSVILQNDNSQSASKR